MIPYVRFHTNLDEPKDYVAALGPRWNGPVPRVGDRVQFRAHRDRRLSFMLDVIEVTWTEQEDITVSRALGATPSMGHEVLVELHIPSWQRSMSVEDWKRWWRSHVEGRP